jgi:pyrrolidone-carboxylate peptidase
MPHGDGVIDLLRLLAHALQGAARARRIVERAAIVVAELDQDEIARLQHFEQAVPMALRQIGAAAASAQRAVDDVDPARVEEAGQRFAPTPLSVRAVAFAVAYGRIADQE